MRCQRCGYEAGGYSGIATCSLCGSTIQGNLIAESGPNRSGAPSTKPGRRSWFAAVTEPMRWVFNTLHTSLIKPDTFFAPLRTKAFPREALLYGLVVGSIATVLVFIANTFFPPSTYSLIHKSAYYSRSTGSSPTMLIMTPVLLCLQFLLAAGYTQLMLLITRNRKNSFSHTFCVMCYASGAAIFEWIPGVGPLVAIIAWFYLALAGLHAVHGITRMRAFLLLLLPLALLFVLVFFLAAIVAVIALAIGGSQLDLLHILGR